VVVVEVVGGAVVVVVVGGVVVVVVVGGVVVVVVVGGVVVVVVVVVEVTATLLTISVSFFETLPAKFRLPVYTAVIMCVPTASELIVKVTLAKPPSGSRMR